MAKTWEDKGGGQWKLTLTSDAPGVPISVFHGTKETIAEQLADSQANANKRLHELRQQNGHTPPPPPPPAGPKPLTAGERMQTVAQLNDPATVESAITRVMESVVGSTAALREAAANAPADREEREERKATEAATAFAAANPDYYPSPHNAETMYAYVKLHGDLTRQDHYQRAYEELTAANLLQKRPSGNEDETESVAGRPERNAPTPNRTPKTQTRISTGISSRDVSGEAPRPTNRLKYTREQIDRMSARDKKRLINDPDYNRAVEFYMQPQRRRTG